MSSQSVTVRDLAGGVRVVTRLAALVLVAAALGACSLFDKDTVIPDEPADKLYNEGLYLLNSKKTPKEAAKKFEEVDRQLELVSEPVRVRGVDPQPVSRCVRTHPVY